MPTLKLLLRMLKLQIFMNVNRVEDGHCWAKGLSDNAFTGVKTSLLPRETFKTTFNVVVQQPTFKPNYEETQPTVMRP